MGIYLMGQDQIQIHEDTGSDKYYQDLLEIWKPRDEKRLKTHPLECVLLRWKPGVILLNQQTCKRISNVIGSPVCV